MDRSLAEAITATIVEAKKPAKKDLPRLGTLADLHDAKMYIVADGGKLRAVRFTGKDKRQIAELKKAIDREFSGRGVETYIEEDTTLIVDVSPLTGREPKTERYKSWNLAWLPQHEKLVPVSKKVLDKAEKIYQKAGVRLSDVQVVIQGKGSNRSHYTSRAKRITLYPKDTSSLETVVHELAHYVHDTMIPGGYRNQEIIDKYNAALREPPKGADDAPDPQKDPEGFGLWVKTTNNRNHIMTFYTELKKLGNKLDKQRKIEEARQINNLVNLLARRYHEIGDDAVTEGWFPVPYGRKNSREFFATLAQEVLIRPKNVPDEAREWIHHMLSQAR